MNGAAEGELGVVKVEDVLQGSDEGGVELGGGDLRGCEGEGRVEVGSMDGGPGELSSC